MVIEAAHTHPCVALYYSTSEQYIISHYTLANALSMHSHVHTHRYLNSIPCLTPSHFANHFLSTSLYFTLLYVTLLHFSFQLLYVYINDYQSGGEMWYAVFSRSLIALLFAAFTLLGYLSLELNQTYLAGPFYFLLPLPFSIVYFWHYCEAKFKLPSMVRNRFYRTEF